MFSLTLRIVQQWNIIDNKPILMICNILNFSLHRYKFISLILFIWKWFLIEMLLVHMNMIYGCGNSFLIKMISDSWFFFARKWLGIEMILHIKWLVIVEMKMISDLNLFFFFRLSRGRSTRSKSRSGTDFDQETAASSGGNVIL